MCCHVLPRHISLLSFHTERKKSPAIRKFVFSSDRIISSIPSLLHLFPHLEWCLHYVCHLYHTHEMSVNTKAGQDFDVLVQLGSTAVFLWLDLLKAVSVYSLYINHPAATFWILKRYHCDVTSYSCKEIQILNDAFTVIALRKYGLLLHIHKEIIDTSKYSSVQLVWQGCSLSAFRKGVDSQVA